MNNTQSNNTKIVLYYGKEFEVPVEHVYIHTDSIGDVYASTLECNKSLTVWLFVEGSRGAAVGSFNHTEMSSINWMLSQKRISELPSVCTGLEQEAHTHADLMLKYAQIAQYSDKPWEEFQVRFHPSIDWVDCTNGYPGFFSTNEYRLKPQTVEPVIKSGQVWEHSVGVHFVVTSVVQSQYLKDTHVTLALELHEQSKVIHRVTATELQQHFTLVK